MNTLKLFFISAFVLFCLNANAQVQTINLIGTSEEFILENVKDFPIVEERGLEHEEFNILVCENKDVEMSFYFTFYKGEKICNYIKKRALISTIKDETNYITTHFTQVKDGIWKSPAGTSQVQISEAEGVRFLIFKEIRQ